MRLKNISERGIFMHFLEHVERIRKLVEGLPRIESKPQIIRLYDSYGLGRREYIADEIANGDKKAYVLADLRLHDLWKQLLEWHWIEDYSLISKEIQEVEANSILVVGITMKCSGQFLKKFDMVYMMINDEWYLKNG